MTNFKFQISNKLVLFKNGKRNIENRGFTLIELIIVMTFFGILMGLATINLLNVKQSSSIEASLNILIADLREAQIKAMVGDTEGRGALDTYGIHFGSNSQTYVIYHGTYSSSESTNFTVSLTDTMRVSTTFPSTEIVFQKGSGEIVGFVNGSNTVTLTDPTNNRTKTITFNKYGVITAIN